MANICTTTYIIDGSKKKLDEIERDVNNLMVRIGTETGGTDFPDLGLLFREIDPENKEWITHMRRCTVKRKKVLEITTESKWSREESTPYSFEELYPGVAVWWMSEELGCGIFETNDENAAFFSEQVIIDTDEGMEYLTEKKAIRKLCRLFGRKNNDTTLDSLQEEAQERNKAIEAGDMKGSFVWVYVAEAA